MSFKLLHLDIETRPGSAYIWSLRKQKISVDQIIEPTSLLCFAMKWHGKAKIIFKKSTWAVGSAYTDMVKTAHELLSEADAVCHFNGISFDMKRLNQEFLLQKLPPVPEIPNIDLKVEVMNNFDLLSSRLAFVAPILGLGEKVKNDGWPLWRGCMAGDESCWRKMRSYNIQDVRLMPRLYEELLPWIKKHPNMNLFNKTRANCTHCGGYKIQQRGYVYKTTLTYIRYQCQSCDHWFQSRSNVKIGPKVEVR